MAYARELIFPALLCAATFFVALLFASAAGISGNQILFDYAALSTVATFITFLAWCGLPFFRSLEFRHLGPSAAGKAWLSQRWPLLYLPLLLSPVFTTGYTVAKSAIPLLVGYQWDGLWADLDHGLFGQDPWRLTHAAIGPAGTLLLGKAYSFLWGAGFALILPGMIFFARPANAIRAYSAMMITWFCGGVVGAAALSSAGPIFAELVDPLLADRFAPLRHSLAALAPANDVILVTQDYLRQMHGIPLAVKGAGISAMPSMHLATAALFVFMARGTVWRVPAIAFWLVIWVGSVHFGYHYAVDGIVGALIASMAWKLTAPRPARAFRPIAANSVPA